MYEYTNRKNVKSNREYSEWVKHRERHIQLQPGQPLFFYSVQRISLVPPDLSLISRGRDKWMQIKPIREQQMTWLRERQWVGFQTHLTLLGKLVGLAGLVYTVTFLIYFYDIHPDLKKQNRILWLCNMWNEIMEKTLQWFCYWLNSQTSVHE